MSAGTSTLETTDPRDGALLRARDLIRQLSARVRELEGVSDDIAIVGMGCRLPRGIRGPEAFWDALRQGRDCITPVPAERWDIDEYYDPQPGTPGRMSSRWGGFVDHVDRFDHEFFSIPAREAALMDPQHRLFLETAWEALEDAGQVPDELAGTSTGVFLAMYGVEYMHEVFADPARVNAYSTLGNLHSMAAGRLSYLLDLRGPCIALDTACSSSLVAVHQACQSLRAGESDLAICGAVNLLLSPLASVSLSQLNESFVGDGRIKAFDKDADGFVRSEGVAGLVLKRAADAHRHGDRIYAVIRGSAINQDGRGAGLTAPNAESHRSLIRTALDRARVTPDEIELVETHGTGTKMGDPIEVDALLDVFGGSGEHELFLGAAKTNVGHLEAAAGMVGIMKAALAVSHGEIPANLHFTEINPHIDLTGTRLTVPRDLVTWRPEGRLRTAGVSSFGLNGTNAHVVLQQPDPSTSTDVERDGIARADRQVLLLSARSSRALSRLARRYQDRLEAASDDTAELCWSARTGRAPMTHRLAVVGAGPEELRDALASVVRRDPTASVLQGRVPGHAPGVVLLFSGAGSQRPGMGRGLIETHRGIATHVQRCDEVLASLGAAQVRPYLMGEPGSHDADLCTTMLGLFVLEHAVATMWQDAGVEVAAVIGHSLGEYAAATFAGVMSLEDGLRLVLERSRLLAELDDETLMVAVDASAAEVTRLLADRDAARIGVAAVNGPEHVTVSGHATEVRAFLAAAEAAGLETQELPVMRSGHSPLVEPVLDRLRDVAATVPMAAPQIPLVSNVTGKLWDWHSEPGPGYWCAHTRQTVRFADGVATLADLGSTIFLEVGPGTDLVGMALGCFSAQTPPTMLSTLRPRRSDWEVVATTVARLWVAGVDVRMEALGHARRVPLPTYPFEPTRCWHDIEPAIRATAHGEARGAFNGPEILDVAPAEIPAPPVLRLELPGRADLLALPLDQQVPHLESRLIMAVQQALGYQDDSITAEAPLSSLGVDSLMAVELRNEIQHQLGVTISVATFLRGATIHGLATEVVEQLREPDEAPATIPTRARVDDERLLALLSQVEGEPAPGTEVTAR